MSPRQAELLEASQHLTDEVRALRSQVATERVARKRLWWPIAALVVAVLALSVLFWNQRSLAISNHRILRAQTEQLQQATRTLDIMQRAVDPTSDIGKQSQRSAQALINQLICDNHRLHGDPTPVVDGISLNC